LNLFLQYGFILHPPRQTGKFIISMPQGANQDILNTISPLETRNFDLTNHRASHMIEGENNALRKS